MASPNSTFTELVTTTFRNHKKEIKDNMSERNALLRYMKRRGNMRTEDGGLTITLPLDYTTNSTYQRYSDWDALNITASDTLTAAEYQWKQIAINVVASGRELRVNSGGTKIIDLAKARIKNALRTFNNNFSTDLYSDGTLSNQINGLQAIIAGTPTNTIGGIDASTWTFWKNTVQSAASPLQGGGAVTVSATTIEGDMMLPLWLELDRGPDDQPDFIVMANDYYTFYEKSQTSIKRYASSESASGGFVTLKYKGADVLYDSAIPDSTAYFINSEYLHLVVHKDADLEVMEETRPVNQDGVVTPLLWMGNMVCSNRKQQGVLKA